MIWIAPSENDTDNAALEKRLWDAAEQAVPAPHFAEADFNRGRPQGLLGLIFLRFAEVRFAAQRAKLEKSATSSRRGSRLDEPAAYHAEGILYLPAEARFDYLLNRPEAENIGAKVNAAMRDVAKCEVRVANSEVQSLRHSKFGIRHSPVPASLDYDAFGRIYEYFLGEFAMSEGQGGGEFYTPSSIVRLLTEVIEPYHGRILETLRLANVRCIKRGMKRAKFRRVRGKRWPCASTSGGMFVSSARFVSEHKKNPAAEIGRLKLGFHSGKHFADRTHS